MITALSYVCNTLYACVWFDKTTERNLAPSERTACFCILPQIYIPSTISDPKCLYRTRNVCIGPEMSVSDPNERLGPERLFRTRTCNFRNAI